MSATLPDLRDRLAERATATPLEIAAARARLEGRLVRDARPPRRGRAWLVTAAAVVVVGVLAVTVVAVVHERPTTGPAAAGPALPVTDYLFDVDVAPLTAVGLTVWFGGVDAASQRAFVEPAGSAMSTGYSAVVQVAYDATSLGVATRPADAQDLRVGGITGWAARHVSAGDDRSYGIDGYVSTWTDLSGLTAKVTATDRTTLLLVTDAVRLGRSHPVLVPGTFAAGSFPSGSTLASVEVDPRQGAQVVVARPGLPDLAVTIDRPGVNVSNGAAVEPLTGPFRLAVPRSRNVDLLTDGVRDLQVAVDDGPTGTPGTPLLPIADLTALVAGMTFADIADPGTWIPVSRAVPLT